MNPIVLAIIFGALAFITVFSLTFFFFGRRRNLEEKIGQHVLEKDKTQFSWRTYMKRAEGLFKPLGDMIPRSPEEMSRQEKRLMRAGIRHKDGPALFYGVKIVLAIILFITFNLVSFPSALLLRFLLAILFGAAIPDLWLSSRSRNRQENIQLAIPDVLDLTVVCVEAGLGLDQSLMRIGSELNRVHPAMSEELRLYNLEVNAGRSRADALRNFANRTDVDDLKSLVAVLIQTDRFGTGVAQSLRVFADSLRTKRRQRAEERAAKTAVKMVPVLVFFIFPAIFIVVVFPAFLSIIRDLIPKIGGQ